MLPGNEAFLEQTTREMYHHDVNFTFLVTVKLEPAYREENTIPMSLSDQHLRTLVVYR